MNFFRFIFAFAITFTSFGAHADILVSEHIKMVHRLVFSAVRGSVYGFTTLTGVDTIQAVGQIEATTAAGCVTFPDLGRVNLDSKIQLGSLMAVLDPSSPGGSTLSFVRADLRQGVDLQVLASVLDVTRPFALSQEVAEAAVIYPVLGSTIYKDHFAQVIAERFPEAADADDWDLQIHHGLVKPVTCSWNNPQRQAQVQVLCESETEMLFEARSQWDKKTPASVTPKP